MAFEQKFVAILQIISQVQQTCVGKPLLELPRPARGLTMLHLAAALGMPRLIDMMRSSVSQLGGMSDVNPASLDDEHCSPLTWACARGNLECTLILHNWCHEMLHARNRLGLTPAMIAKQRGHILLVETLTEQVIFLYYASPVFSIVRPYFMYDMTQIFQHISRLFLANFAIL